MKCRRCGCESSVFWWPYSMGCSDNGNHPNDVFHLCDKCQTDFIEFMSNKRWPFFDIEKLKKEMDEAGPMPFVQPEVKEAKE